MIATKFVLLFFGLIALGAGDSFSSDEEVDVSVQGRILGGSTAPEGAYLYQASIRDDFNQHFCGGAIIAPRTILTAAQCVVDRLPSRTFVTVGSNMLGVGGVRHTALLLRLHPQYNVVQANDIGIINTLTTIVMTSTVKAIAYDSTYIGAGTASQVTGWGFTQTNGPYYANMLQILNTKTISNTECESKMTNILLGNLCTYAGLNKGVCNGDIGGPLVYNNRVIGIASRIVPCGKGFPDVFTRVSAYVSWISANRM